MKSKEEKLAEGLRVAEAVAKFFGWQLYSCGYLYEGARFHDPSGHRVETNRYHEINTFSIDGFGLTALGRACGVLPKHKPFSTEEVPDKR